MKRKIFPFIAAIVLTAATVIPASAATVKCRPCQFICRPCGIFCPETEQKPCVPETPKPEQKPEVPDTEENPIVPDVPEIKPDVPEVPETKPEVPEAPETNLGAMSQLEQAACELINEQRVKNGLKPLTISEELSVKARVKSTDMLENNYFSHNSPTYGSPFALMKSLGITYRSAAENIAMGYKTAEAVVNAWMNSPGHRANILSSNYTSMGIGHVDGYWTQWFIG